MAIRCLASIFHKTLLRFPQIGISSLSTSTPQFRCFISSPSSTLSSASNFVLYCPSSYYLPVRNSTIFTSLPSDVIWEGVTGPKGSTKKRARGKRRVTRPKIDLNRGQRLGGNREGYLWPGLNAPLYEKSFLQKVQKVHNHNKSHFY